MKIYFIKYRTIYFVLISLIIILILSFLYSRSISIKTFNNKDNLYYEGNGESNTVAFTCNVDWGEELVPVMLQIFEKEKLKITFFVTGKWAEKNPELLRKIYNNGHEIGNHGYIHRNYGNLSYKINLEEIKKADNIIAKIIGHKPLLFAPPSGDFSEATLRAATDQNHKTIMWSVDTIDWRKDSSRDIIIKRVVSKSKKNSIILMHPKEETIKALPTIIKELKNKGLNIGKVSDILK
ncbi:polysaccharide deacetylase family protein [Clostridium sp. D2Q-11]|uniref:Polysaccharide deacetylase family protein n=1 Tax=Anaeromonas frigoriresistens TaxID=2683708 RepID=A0A942UVM5_9FIRM|nr:polysaccharide deacetylase family protein [Anaeromonas frigoriresistens]MBS4539898.1 polysaccharide deacetylase family protein [Anaeromonas frigoriresistens]